MARKAKQAEVPPTNDLHSPDLAILTPEGCRRLIGIGEKALPVLMARGLPFVQVGNSYRYPRATVLEWFYDESRKPKNFYRRR